MNKREEIPMKSRFPVAAMVAALLGALACASATAHHSFAVFFDSEDGVVSVRGIVTQFNFTNPHGVIRLNVKDKNGAVVEWKAETNSPSILERRGWKKDSLKVGEEIVVEGWRARDGANYMRMRKVTRADGTPVGIPFASLEVK
jgi:proline racemase